MSSSKCFKNTFPLNLSHFKPIQPLPFSISLLLHSLLTSNPLEFHQWYHSLFCCCCWWLRVFKELFAFKFVDNNLVWLLAAAVAPTPAPVAVASSLCSVDIDSEDDVFMENVGDKSRFELICASKSSWATLVSAVAGVNFRTLRWLRSGKGVFWGGSWRWCSREVCCCLQLRELTCECRVRLYLGLV